MDTRTVSEDWDQLWNHASTDRWHVQACPRQALCINLWWHCHAPNIISIPWYEVTHRCDACQQDLMAMLVQFHPPMQFKHHEYITLTESGPMALWIYKPTEGSS